MPAGAGSTSYLMNLARRRQQIQRSRALLGLGERGVQPVQQPLPPQKPPADVRGPQQAPAPAATPAPGGAGELTIPDATRARMLQQTEQFLASLQSGGRAMPSESRYQAAQKPTDLLTARLLEWGAEGLKPEEQFYRVAGRYPSPRELALFSARVELERLLNRPPTRNEMKMHLLRTSGLSPAHPRAVEA